MNKHFLIKEQQKMLQKILCLGWGLFEEIVSFLTRKLIYEVWYQCANYF